MIAKTPTGVAVVNIKFRCYVTSVNVTTAGLFAQLREDLACLHPCPRPTPFLNFPYGAIQMECEANDLIVEGEIPSDLNGTLYRAGPNQRFAPRGDYHLFAGDGMVHAFHIKDGKANYNNRWVRTAKFNIEDKEGRCVINAMNPFDCEPEYSDFVLTDKEGLANTATVWHGGRLLVMEEGHRPYELDPVTLESIGSWDFRGKLQTAMTAHPKIDPDTGEMIFFAYMATGPFLLRRHGAQGRCQRHINREHPCAHALLSDGARFCDYRELHRDSCNADHR